ILRTKRLLTCTTIRLPRIQVLLFFCTAPAPPAIYTLSLHDALPIWLAMRDITLSADTSTRTRLSWFLCAASSRSRKNQESLVRRSEEHTSELQSPYDLVCRLLLEKKKR